LPAQYHQCSLPIFSNGFATIYIINAARDSFTIGTTFFTLAERIPERPGKHEDPVFFVWAFFSGE
jgi:hypothetical protein